MIRPSGWIPEPPNPKDLPADEILMAAGAVPAASNNSGLMPSLIVQTEQDCTVNSVALAVRAAQIRERPSVIPDILSRRMMYLLMRRACGFGEADSGGYIRGVFAMLNKFGFCPESLWEYTRPLNQQPSFTAMAAAIDQRAPTVYRRIFTTGAARVDQMKRALGAGHLVVFGTPISQEMMTLRDATPIKPPASRSEWIGGHAMCLVDHQGDDFRIAQTWGPHFADHGWMHMHADYLEWSETGDCWIVEKAPEFSL